MRRFTKILNGHLGKQTANSLQRFCLAEAHGALSIECKLRIAEFSALNDAARLRRRALEIYFHPTGSRGFKSPFMPKRAFGRTPIRTQGDWVADLASSARSQLVGMRSMRLSARFSNPLVKATTLL
jgi:hypothetical protein